MTITDVKIRKIIENTGKIKALVSITLSDCFTVHDIRIIEGNDRLFVAMPRRKDARGSFQDICHPIGQAARIELEAIILGAYEAHIAELQPLT